MWSPSTSCCAPPWLHQTTSSSTVPSLLATLPGLMFTLGPHSVCRSLLHRLCFLRCRTRGQQTSRRPFPFSQAPRLPARSSAHGMARTFIAALGCAFWSSTGRSPSLTCKHLESRTVPYSVFYLSPPLKCLLNSSEKTETGTHHNFLYRAVNV